MKIKLKNFKCYDNREFDFGIKGISLLSGMSGSGKTTILQAIHFVLFGTGNKLVSYGKSSCKVEFEYDGLNVVRTKRPNRLVVNGVYEDDSGQSIINKKFGKNFEVTGYISQNARNSFILKSPIEKLIFLENFAFENIDLLGMKKRCKDLIKERNDSLIKTSSQLEFATKILEELEIPEIIEFPLKCSVKNREKVIKNEIVKNKNTNIMIYRCLREIKKLESSINNLKIFNVKIKNFDTIILKIDEKLNRLNDNKQSIDKYCGDKQLEEYIDKLYDTNKRKELIQLEERYEENKIQLNKMIESESNEKMEKIKNMKKNLWSEYSESEVRKNISEFKIILEELEELNRLKKKIKNINLCKDLEDRKEKLKGVEYNLTYMTQLVEKLKNQKEVYKCPSCDTHLKLQEEKLCVVIGNDMNKEGELEELMEKISDDKEKFIKLDKYIKIAQINIDRYDELKYEIKEIEKKYDEIPQYEEMKDDLEYIIEYKISQKELRKQIKKLLLSQDSHTSSIKTFENDLNRQEECITKIKNVLDNSTDLCIDISGEELRHIINKEKINKNKINDIEDRINILEKEKSDVQIDKEDEFTNYNEQNGNFKDELCLKKLKELLDSKNKEMNNWSDKKRSHIKNIEKIKKWEEWNKADLVYKSYKNKIDEFKSEETVNRLKLASATILKKTILEAESIAMSNMISSINAHSQVYLDAFFPDNSILVKLLPFKITKKGKTITKKPQINIQIEYKGMEIDINMLSGGEISRVILAFALALGEMFNTPIMLLDECTASLDEELTGVVMEGIEENFTGKLVIIIAHQIIKGCFSKVINI